MTASNSNQEWIVQPGTDVYGSDDRKIGEIEDIRDGHLIVRKGFLFTHDLQVPFSAIAGHTEDRIDLSVTADQAGAEDWATAGETTGSGADQTDTTSVTTSDIDRATAGATTTTDSAGDYAADTYNTSGTRANDADTTGVGMTDAGGMTTAATHDREATSVMATSGDATTGTVGDADRASTSGSSPDYAVDTGRDDTDTVQIPVIEETLEATKHGVERGAVRISTNVTEQEASLDVPVTEERVRVERHAVDREADGTAFTGDNQTITMTVHGEEVDVEKRARVVEEVEIGKETVHETRHVTDTVRRQEVDVDESGVQRTDSATRTDRSDPSDTEGNR